MNTPNNDSIKRIGGWSWYWLSPIFMFVMFWLISGEIVIPSIFAVIAVILLAVQSPFLKIVEVSPGQIVVRRNNRFAKPIYKFKTTEIKSATTMLPPTLPGIFKPSAYGPYRRWLILYMKDGSKIEIYLGVFIRKQALMRELSKYVGVLDFNFWNS